MPRRNRQRKAQRGTCKRGRHKRAESRETALWEAECLIPEPPPCLGRDTYTKLARLRSEL